KRRHRFSQPRRPRAGREAVPLHGRGSHRPRPSRAEGTTAARTKLFHCHAMNATLKTQKVKLLKSARRLYGANGSPSKPHPPAGAASSAKLKTLKSKLIRQGVKYCLGAYVDIHGVPKGKFVPIEHFEHFAHGSELYTGYALDGLGQEPNDD